MDLPFELGYLLLPRPGLITELPSNLVEPALRLQDVLAKCFDPLVCWRTCRPCPAFCSEDGP
jgi:hypothetical protein